jgi:hypothetical protein
MRWKRTMLAIRRKATSDEPAIQSATAIPAIFRACPPAIPLTSTGGVRITGRAPLSDRRGATERRGANSRAAKIAHVQIVCRNAAELRGKGQ